MLLLVTDTSGRQGSVALARVGEDASYQNVIEVAPLAGGAFSAQLVPQIATLLAKYRFNKTDIDAFIVVSGPGSFTGLRVGLAAIKALAEVLKKPIVPVSLLEVLALASHQQGKVAALLDAGRGDVYFGLYEIAGDSMQVLREQLLSKSEFLSGARNSSVVTPDPRWLEAAQEARLSAFPIGPASPEMIVRFGWKRLLAGESVSPEQLEANYMRRSDAEMFVKPGF
jgi:tRNA threonylcarbamoyladenosine biosynthesis protein TsaB